MATNENKQVQLVATGQQGDQKQDGSDDMDQWIEDMNSGTTKVTLQKNIAKQVRMNPQLRKKLMYRVDRLYRKKIPDTPANRRKLKEMLWRLIYNPMLMAKSDFWDSCSKTHQVGVAVSKNSNPIKFPFDEMIGDIIDNAGT